MYVSSAPRLVNYWLHFVRPVSNDQSHPGTLSYYLARRSTDICNVALGVVLAKSVLPLSPNIVCVVDTSVPCIAEKR